MFKHKHSRRMFLTGTRNAVVSIPFLQSLVTRAHGAVQNPAKRFLAFYSPNGQWLDAFYPSEALDLNAVAGGAAIRLADIPGNAISESLSTSVFRQLQDKTLIIRGLDALVQNSIHPDLILNGQLQGKLTIDQIMADLIYAAEPTHRFLGMIPNRIGPRSFIAHLDYSFSYGASGQAVAYYGNATYAYQQLFVPIQDQLKQTAPETTPMVSPADLRRRSALDFVIGDIRTMNANPRLSAKDRQNLDEHLTALRSIEQRIGAQTEAISAMCQMPVEPQGWAEGRHCGGDLTGEAALEMMLDLFVMSIRCNLTRVGCFQLGQSTEFYTDIIDSDSTACYGTEGWHGYTHESTRGAKVEKYIAIARYHGTKMMEALQSLDQIVEDEATGNTILDNTLAIWGNEIGYGHQHLSIDIPTVLIGGKGVLNTGYFVDYRRKDQPINGGYAGRAYNELLVTLLQGMGLRPDQYEQDGEAGFGPYPEGKRELYDFGDKRTPLPFVGL